MTLQERINTLPAGQRRVVTTLLGSSLARSYTDVAARLGIHVGTVYTHLRRVRLRHPELYTAIMAQRARQIALRRRRSLHRASEHSRQWHKRQANRRYYYRFGRWPWDRWS